MDTVDNQLPRRLDIVDTITETLSKRLAAYLADENNTEQEKKKYTKHIESLLKEAAEIRVKVIESCQ